MIVKNVEKKDKGTVAVTVELDKQEFESAVNKAYIKNKNQINVPGFRKGKAPRKIIENMYGEKIFYEDAIDAAAMDAFNFAVEDKQLSVVGRPSLVDANVSDEKELTVVFSVGAYPEVTLKSYKGLRAYKPAVEVTDEDVQNELDKALEKNSRLVTVENRAAALKDTVVIDFEGFTDGVAFAGGKADNYELALGSGSFIPGFEDQIVGMQVGEEKEINVKFPDDYAPELSGKDAMFKVKLHEIKEKILPAADDEFAKDVSEFDTLAEYKDSLKKKLETEKEETADTVYRQGLLEELIKNVEADIPDAMVDEQLEKMVQDYSMRMQSQGMDLETYLKMVGISMEDFLKSGRLNAENQVKVNLGLKKITELENMDASDEEVEAEYERLAKLYTVDIAKVKEVMGLEQMKSDLKMMKAEKLIGENGVKLDSKPEETASEKTAE